jgi:uncharacterized protein (DUF1778 family)
MKQKRIEIRVSNLDKKMIEKRAEKANLSVSEFVLKTALGERVKQAFSDEEVLALKDLHQFNNNFSRIANLIKKNDSEVMKEIYDTQQAIKRVLNKIK